MMGAEVRVDLVRYICVVAYLADNKWVFGKVNKRFHNYEQNGEDLWPSFFVVVVIVGIAVVIIVCEKKLAGVRPLLPKYCL